MDPKLRIITRLPLTELWRDDGVCDSHARKIIDLWRCPTVAQIRPGSVRRRWPWRGTSVDPKRWVFPLLEKRGCRITWLVMKECD